MAGYVEYMEAGVPSPSGPTIGVGQLLRTWRRRRKLSQLDLALIAGTSTRHLSCVETGRSRPSRAMVLRLAEYLDVPLQERNNLLLAAGYAPVFQGSSLDSDQMMMVRAALNALLAGHEPYPATVIDQNWDVVESNRAMSVLLASVPAHLTDPGANVMRLILHPDGLASQCLNFPDVRAHAIGRLLHQVTATGNADLRALYEEVSAYSLPSGEAALPVPPPDPASAGVVVPLRIRTPFGVMSMFSMIATVGAPADITLSDLAVESFHPLDESTAQILRRLAESA
ncbi:helix-turn-helix domain-containing protein [Frankia sp. R82]|uniref:helix-turn-helix domain-containing protein n=1 Tax=Frankia sp. R82 TaxID=2950553 RepID=UPI0020443C52|nr:helix-turn-helix transcriptional regulator [Frankia sp. R82]MCM3882625.1 helix-turn-helix transcriptional regulator [Frankia sp. R82]